MINIDTLSTLYPTLSKCELFLSSLLILCAHYDEFYLQTVTIFLRERERERVNLPKIVH